MTKLFVQKIHPDAELPVKSTTHAAAYDVCAYLEEFSIVKTWRDGGLDECTAGMPVHSVYIKDSPDCPLGIYLEPGERAIIPTGLKIATDVNHCTLVLPRSGLSIKQGLTVINAPGLIDPDYRDELKVLIVNLSNVQQIIKHGDRIAQIRVERIIPLDVEEVLELPGTDSNRTGGLGSTGVASDQVPAAFVTLCEQAASSGMKQYIRKTPRG